MKMKELSSLTGISDRTIRYYIDDGLFIPERYTENYEGRRSYDFTENDAKHLKQIALLRKYGFSISEIKTIEKDSSSIEGLVKSRIAEAKQNSEEKLDEIKVLQTVAERQPESIDELCETLSNPDIEQVPIPAIDDKSAFEPMYKKSKKHGFIVSLVLAFAIVLLGVACTKIFFKEIRSEFSVDIIDNYRYMYQDYIHHLSDGYCIFRESAETHSLVYYPLWREHDVVFNIEEYILNEVSIYKYGLSKNAEWIYVHYYSLLDPFAGNTDDLPKIYYNTSEQGVLGNVYFLFKVKDKTEIEFENNAQFYEYCEKNGIVFEKFYYPMAHASLEESRVYINENAYLSLVGSTYGNSVVLNNEAIFTGFIDEYSIINENTFAFSLKISDKLELEYPSKANEGIVLSDKKVGKYKLDSLLYLNLYYSKYIVYDFATNSFREYDKRKDIEKEYDTVFVRLTR